MVHGVRTGEIAHKLKSKLVEDRTRYGDVQVRYDHSEPWLRVEPASGRLASGKEAFVKLTAGPVKLPSVKAGSPLPPLLRG